MTWTHSNGLTTTITGSVDITINGVIPQLDDTDKLATSIYGKNVVPGDTPIAVDFAGEFRSSSESKFLLEDLLVQLRIMNLYLSSMVGDVFNELDLED